MAFKIHSPMKKNYFYSKTEFVLELFLPKKHILLLVTLTLFLGNYPVAQTAGANITGTGTIPWTNPSNITNTADTNYATAVLSNNNSNYLQGIIINLLDYEKEK